MTTFAMTQASPLVRFLAGNTADSWEPTAQGGVIVHHSDYDQPITRCEIEEAVRNYPERC